METSVPHVRVLVVQLVYIATEEIVDHGIELRSASRVFEEEENEVVVVGKLFELKELCAKIVAFKDSYFPRIEVLFIWDLVHHFAKVHHEFYIAVSC